MKYLCPVCGYPGLEEPPDDYAICPSCGVEFGNDDAETSHEVLREQWLSSGAQWFSQYTSPPAGWHPYLQVLAAGLAHDLTGRDVGVQGLSVALEGLNIISAEPTFSEVTLSEKSVRLALAA